MSVRRLNHAVLYVSDLSRAVEFYRERSASRSAPRSRGGPPSCAHPARPTTTTWACSRSAPPRAAAERRVGLYHLAWEVGTLSDLADIRSRLSDGRRAGRGQRSPGLQVPYAKDPDGIEFEVMWRVPAQDWESELSHGDMIAPLDLEGARARWGDQVTGAAAGSPT